MTERSKPGFPPTVGRDIARTWATQFGVAWVLASDLIDPPGVFASYANFQALERALNRCGFTIERMPYDNRSYLYRLPPDVVKELTYGGQ